MRLSSPCICTQSVVQAAQAVGASELQSKWQHGSVSRISALARHRRMQDGAA